MKDRDLPYENAYLLLRDFLIYYDGYNALRSGDSGRFEKHLQMVGVMYQGMPKLKHYRQLILDFNAVRALEWTDEMRELWLSNAFVNLTGKPNKFIAIDEFNEWVVRAVKRVYNQHGSIPSTDFTCDIISPNVMPMRESYRGILKSSGAPDWGYKRSRVEINKDIEMVVHELSKGRVFTYTPGRTKLAGLPLVPDADTFMEGIEAIVTGDTIAKYVHAKLNDNGGYVKEKTGVSITPNNRAERTDVVDIEMTDHDPNFYRDDNGYHIDGISYANADVETLATTGVFEFGAEFEFTVPVPRDENGNEIGE